MATGHTLSVVTNSCVKRPRKPKTNLPESLLESQKFSEGSNFNGDVFSSSVGVNGHRSAYHQDDDSHLAQSHVRGNVAGSAIWAEDALIDQLTHDVENISSEEFYERLQELKKKHRATLESLESRYNEKLSHKRRQSADYEYDDDSDREELLHETARYSSPANGIHRVKGMTRSGPVYVAEHKHKHLDDDLERFNQSLPAWSALPRDNVKDMSAKPPSGRPHSAWNDRSSRSRNHTPDPHQKKDWSDITWTSGSECSATTEEILSSVNTSLNLTLSKQPGSPANVVENMWDDFNVDSYAPRSRSLSRSSARSSTSQQSKSKEWSPKITIPKPFSMTMRESSIEQKKTTRASMEVEQKRLDREKQEEIECQKKFKATPVPAHTFLPLYDELMSQQAEKSKTNRDKSKQKILETQKPFKLTDTKKHHRSHSAPLSMKTKTPKFKAKPVPMSVFDPRVDERILEEEEYRKIRIQMRAEEMLRQSTLPPNMQIRGKEYTDGKLRMSKMREREKLAFLTSDHKFQPQVNGEIPDYDELYHRFQAEVQRKKREKEPTVVEPFNLRTARIPSRKAKIIAEMEDEERMRKEALRGTLSKSASLRRSIDSGDTIPSKTTASTELRKSVTARALMDKAEKEKAELEKQRQQRYKQKRLQRFIASKAQANDTSRSLEATNHEKLRQYKQADKEREEEYERELQEMMARIESRPLLFERETELNAKKRAERKYEEALRSAGISEDFLVKKGRRGVTASSSSFSRGAGEEESESEASYNYGDDDDFGQDSDGERDEEDEVSSTGD
ncbi:protein FAM161B-like [Diadema antillarum]|uniref:protein FAM161B-like n=1 Tax=Diadema antillarum TaxID=105358 RepID=UPI003A83B23A